jgi:uncharacterized protein (TIGR03083 family)
MTTVDRDHIVAALDEVWDGLANLAADLAADDWDRPTACPGWTVKDQYAHVLGTEASLTGAPTPEVALPAGLSHVRNDMGLFNETWIEHYRLQSVPDLLADLGEALITRRAALATMDQAAFDEPAQTPAGPDTYGRLMRVRVMDQWFHQQDVREATGHPGGLEGVVPQVVLDEVTAVLGYAVGKKAGVGAGASVRFELTGPIARRIDVEVTDRARVVDGLRGTPTVTLTLPGDRFLRIAGGRLGDADPVDGSVEISGDRALGEQVLRGMAFMI